MQSTLTNLVRAPSPLYLLIGFAVLWIGISITVLNPASYFLGLTFFGAGLLGTLAAWKQVGDSATNIDGINRINWFETLRKTSFRRITFAFLLVLINLGALLALITGNGFVFFLAGNFQLGQAVGDYFAFRYQNGNGKVVSDS